MSLILFACAPNVIPPIDNDDELDEELPEVPSPIEYIFTDPVETNRANTNFLPAFEGQTRVQGVITSTPYTSTILTNQLNEPWGIDVLPSGELVITEKTGQLRILKLDGSLSEPIRGFPSLNTTGQGGLLDVAVSPNFIEDRMLVFTLSLRTQNGSLSAVMKAQLSSDLSSLSNMTIIHQATPSFSSNAHFGSRVVFDHNGALLISTGDRQSLQTRGNAQTLNNGHGKIIRITLDGDPAPNNPFIDQGGYARYIYAYGLRNTQGLAIHPQTQELWGSDMGPRGGDELNRILSSKNYGWPFITYGTEYNGTLINQGKTQNDGMEQPVYYWDPAVAPSGMIFYHSDVIKEWENNIFIATLRGNHIIRLVLKGNTVLAEERLLSSEGQRFRDLAMGLQGEIYAITDEGRLYKISKLNNFKVGKKMSFQLFNFLCFFTNISYT
jgi:glucose/arabinose dehydrogenase